MTLHSLSCGQELYDSMADRSDPPWVTTVFCFAYPPPPREFTIVGQAGYSDPVAFIVVGFSPASRTILHL